MKKIDHTRHMGIFDASTWPVTLIGAGGIGALTAITLGKMGVPALILFHGDRVSPENMATQFYSPFDVERYKLAALHEHMAVFAPDTVLQINNFRVDGSTPWSLMASPIVISALDSIEARKGVWEAIKDKSWMWYLEARMGAEVFQLHAVNGDDRNWYDQMLASQDDSLIPDEPCTATATIYTACIAAGQIGKTVRQIVAGENPPQLLIHDIVTGAIIQVGG